MHNHKFKFENGQTVEESISGFKGVVTGRVTYLTGCDQYLITQRGTGAKPEEPRWYDENRLTLVNEPIVTLPGKTATSKNGADAPAPVK